MLFKRSFFLEQHTPVLQFQQDPRSATIRATELKPKLDRFLCKIIGDFEECKHFLAGYSEHKKADIQKLWNNDGFRSLDYTVAVKCSGHKFSKVLTSKEQKENKKAERQIHVGENSIPTFFANLGEEGDSTAKYIATAETSVTFRSLNTELLDLIDQNIAAFFWHHNFGTRQSKGWGSFTPVEKTGYDSFTPYLPEVFFQYSVESGRGNYRRCFESINDFYKVLRSGMNGVSERWNADAKRSEVYKRTHYCKPVIFEYASFKREEGKPKDLVLQWEKKTIKQQLLQGIPPSLQEQINEPKHSGHKNADSPLLVKHTDRWVLKDLMGFSTIEAWHKYRVTISKSHKSEDPADEIKRMKSPMFFKPVKNETGYDIYFRFDPIPKEIRGAKINFSAGRRSVEIPMLSPPDGFFENMIRFAANEIDWDDFFKVNTLYGPNAEAEGMKIKVEIKRIFEQIRNNLPN